MYLLFGLCEEAVEKLTFLHASLWKNSCFLTRICCCRFPVIQITETLWIKSNGLSFSLILRTFRLPSRRLCQSTKPLLSKGSFYLTAQERDVCNPKVCEGAIMLLYDHFQMGCAVVMSRNWQQAEKLNACNDTKTLNRNLHVHRDGFLKAEAPFQY